MSREIRKEHDWWDLFGNSEKEVVYEDGHRVGEVRTEETLLGFGPNVQRTYDNDGQLISETRNEETLCGFGPNVQRTYDTEGERISETRNEETLLGFGPTVQRTYDTEGHRVSEILREATLAGFGPTVKREYDTDRGHEKSEGNSYNSVSKYATYSRPEILGQAKVIRRSAGPSCSESVGDYSGSVRSQVIRHGRPSRINDHRRIHVRDHR